MVGNDPTGDMAAKLAGLKTYRTTDAETSGFATATLTDPAAPPIPAMPAPDFTGPLSGLLDVVEGVCDTARLYGNGGPFGSPGGA